MASSPRADWEAAALKALRGAPLESLVTTTLDGIDIAPLYTSETSAPVNTGARPGQASYRRGGSPISTTQGWEMRQRHRASADANAAILADLERGITAITLVDATDAAGIAAALEHVMLDLAPVRLPGGTPHQAADALLELFDARGHQRDDIVATLGVDPLARLARSGSLPIALDDAIAHGAHTAAEVTRDWPHVTTYEIDGTAYADAGASDAEEVAAVLSAGVTYLRAMTDAGLTTTEAARQIDFTLSVGPDQFGGIAKIRAARVCWARVLEACGVDAADRGMRVHAVTAWAMLTAHDRWTNMLRTTTACFAAAVGGADAITVSPFDAAAGEPSELGHRIARNTQSILADESMIGAVADPAGGSWYVEDLTDALAESNWSAFQSLEGHGGIGTALLDGTAQRVIAATNADRDARIATRADGIVGVSEFPDLSEDIVAPVVAPPTPSADAAVTCEPLVPRRWSEPFDDLRRRAASSTATPVAFLANLDVPAVHNARATFSQNLLAAGGVDVATNDGFATTDECVAAFGSSGAPVAVICSSDKVYAERAAATAAALKAAGCRWVVLAGAPGDTEDGLRAAGVDDFVHMGCDVVQALTRIHDAIGVDR